MSGVECCVLLLFVFVFVVFVCLLFLFVLDWVFGLFCFLLCSCFFSGGGGG